MSDCDFIQYSELLLSERPEDYLGLTALRGDTSSCYIPIIGNS